MSRSYPFLVLLFVTVALCGSAATADEGGADLPSAESIIDALVKNQQTTGFSARARLSTNNAENQKESIQQLRVIGQHSDETTRLFYQIIWPKSTAGTGLYILRNANGETSAFSISPDQPPTKRTPGDYDLAFANSALSIGDLVEDFWAWDAQQVLGEVDFDGQSCWHIQSKREPPSMEATAMVETFVDKTRHVPLRLIKKNASGDTLRTLTASRIMKRSDDSFVAAVLEIKNHLSGKASTLTGSRSRRGIELADAEFPSVDEPR